MNRLKGGVRRAKSVNEFGGIIEKFANFHTEFDSGEEGEKLLGAGT